MAKKYRFMVRTTLYGSVTRELEDGVTPDEMADEIAAEEPSYDDMDREHIVSVECEVDDYYQVSQ